MNFPKVNSSNLQGAVYFTFPDFSCYLRYCYVALLVFLLTAGDCGAVVCVLYVLTRGHGFKPCPPFINFVSLFLSLFNRDGSKSIFVQLCSMIIISALVCIYVVIVGGLGFETL